LSIDLSETKDQMEVIRRYEARLKKGKDDPTWFILTKKVVDVFFDMKKDFEKLYQESLFFEGRKCENLDDLASYVVVDLHELEARFYSKNMDEVDCTVCGHSVLIFDDERAEETCKNCEIVIREKITEKEIEKIRGIT